MRFFEIVVSGAALLSSAFAATIDTYPSSGVEAGKSYTVTYSPKDATVTFILRKGLSTNLDTVGTIGTATGGSFTWNVAKDLPSGPGYALEIQAPNAQPNYSGQFGLTGGSAAVSSVVSSAVASASAAVSSASAAASSARASVSSVLASLSSKASTAAASASIMPSAGLNSTVASPTLSRSASGTSKPTGSSSSTGGIPQSTGAAASLSSSPMALVFGAVAAIAYLY